MVNAPSIHVSSGAFKGRRLAYPPSGSLRPTMARTREAVFDSLADVVSGAVFVDLYAGAGAMGIEAISRGARFTTFVEIAPAALSCLVENLGRLEVGPDRSEVFRGDVAAFVAGGGLEARPIGVVFADPPYDDDVESLLALLDGKAYPQVQFLVVEHRAELPETPLRHWQQVRSRRYGMTRVSYFEPLEGGAP